MPSIIINTAAQNGLNWGAKGVERIMQNVSNIVNTYQAEVAYNRAFGVSTEIVDKTAEQIRAIIADDLLRQIAAGEPRAKLESIEIVSIDESGRVGALVEISV